MKNIHVLPTDKPSRLQLFEGINEFEFELCSKDSFFNKGVHTYITNDEEIKEGDWFITDDKRIEKCAFDWKAREWHKKIILTTDADLIKDGVQAIDDEFLEWFVKNPSCERVEIEKETKSIQLQQQQLSENSYDLAFRWVNKEFYKIIIPKETLEKTAVEWLLKQMQTKLFTQQNATEIINQAKEMEKQQIKEAYLRGIENYDPTFKIK